jgi:hypothetical protein
MIIRASNSFKPRRKSKKAPANAAPKRKKAAFVEMKSKPEPYRAPSHSHIKSLMVDSVSYANNAPQYEGDMAEREATARAEAERLKKCVAPAFNKGAYTLIATPEQAKWIGRK